MSAISCVHRLVLRPEESAHIEFGEHLDVVTRDAPEYDGPYEFTPSAETQVVRTAGHYVDGDMVIGPIPPNYGLVTWDGSTLTVS